MTDGEPTRPVTEDDPAAVQDAITCGQLAAVLMELRPDSPVFITENGGARMFEVLAATLTGGEHDGAQALMFRLNTGDGA